MTVHPVKILFLLRALNYGGAERQLIVLAKGLHERGHEVVVAVFYPGAPLEKDLREAGIRIRPLNKRGRWDLFAFLMRYARVVWEESPDVIHGYLEDPNIVIALCRFFLPPCRIVWGVRSSAVDQSKYDWVGRWGFKLSCWLSKCADLIIANSYTGRKDYLASGYPAAKTITIHNGIDIERFRPDPEARRMTRHEWDVRDDETLIGLVGRLNPQKDHRTFLNAVALLMKEEPHARFVCVGDGPVHEQAALQEFGKRLGLADRLIWSRAQERVSRVYNALDLLVSSSAYGEGFSNVVGEAMACGTPCVATDVGDSGFVMGECGELVRPKDPDALKAGMQRALKRRLLRGEIRQRILDHFSLDNLVVATERALLELSQRQPDVAAKRRENVPPIRPLK